MKTHFTSIIVWALLWLCLPFGGTEVWGSSREYPLPILDELDDAIRQKEEYRARKEARIHALKQRLAHAAKKPERYECCKSLFEEYLHYQADSAIYYLNLRATLLPLEGHEDLEEEVAIDRAAVMGVMGMYADALHLLEKVNPNSIGTETLREYYRACRSCYGWLTDYTLEKRVKQKYQLLTDLYRDSIRQADLPINGDIAQAERKALSGRADEAIVLLQKYLPEEVVEQEKADMSMEDMEIQSYLNYTMYEAYLAKGEVEKQIEYLARTALWDMKRVVREYASLHKLARLLYEQGDIDRAYKEKEAHERAVVTGLLLGISLLALSLIVAVSYLYYWMKKLAAMRRSLYEANKQLQAVNQNLEQTGKIKEVYIARYLDRCVGYLEKLEQYRRSLEKLAMASKLDALFKAIRSDQFLRDERKAFYRDFDHSFLDLFPHFVENFNRLLVDDGRIMVKQGELLNTELRIFALIRLGVTDTNSIAHFLGYSLATVYNYRSKIRNKAVGDKDKFEQEVMGIDN